MAKEVSFVIRIDDKGTLKRVTMDSRELEKAVRGVREASEAARRDVISWAEAAQAVDVLHGTIGELQGVMQDLTSAYQVQLVAETQLDTIIPAMNNLIAQQEGLHASTQGAGRTEIDLRVRGRDLVKAAANDLRSTRRRSGLK